MKILVASDGLLTDVTHHLTGFFMCCFITLDHKFSHVLNDILLFYYRSVLSKLLQRILDHFEFIDLNFLIFLVPIYQIL